MKKILVIDRSYERHGSVWRVVYNSFYNKFILHTGGPSYVHDKTFRGNRIQVWSWDKNGDAEFLRHVSRKKMNDKLRQMRSTFKRIP